MKLQIQSVIYGNQVDALVKAMKALQQAVKVYHRRVGDLQVRLIYGDSTPTPVLDEKTQKDIREMLKAEIEFEYKVFGFNSGTAKGHNLMAENTDADIMMIMNPDVILEPTCLCKLMEPLKLKEVGMVEARQTPLEHAKEYNTKTGETEWASTACTVFKTEVYNKINGFDAETFFLYCDDLDFPGVCAWLVIKSFICHPLLYIMLKICPYQEPGSLHPQKYIILQKQPCFLPINGQIRKGQKSFASSI